MCASPFCASPATCTASYGNFPVRYVPEPDRSQEVQRHDGMRCICLLLDCCHHEHPEDNYLFSHRSSGHHMDSGSPRSGYLYPWEPGDESWREESGLGALLA